VHVALNLVQETRPWQVPYFQPFGFQSGRHYSMNTIHRLREALLKALSPQESRNDEQELFDELMVQKSRLIKLFDVGPRNAQEQREIESGRVTCIFAMF